MSANNSVRTRPVVLRAEPVSVRVLTLRPPKVGPVLGYLRATSVQRGHIQRVFFTIESSFLDSPSRGLIAWCRIDARATVDEARWRVRHGLAPGERPAAGFPDLADEYDPQLTMTQSVGPVNRLVTAFTADLPVGREGRWMIVCLSLSLGVGIDGPGDLEEDGDARPADGLLQLLEALKQRRLSASGEEPLEAERHEYPDRREHRSVVLDLEQSACGADQADVGATAPASASAPAPGNATGLRFAVGACRYPGTEMDRTRRDRMLDVMRGERAAFHLLVGDSIYADAAVDVATQRSDQERWVDRYTSAFMSRGFARLLGSAPTYFLPDDHEISNDWFAHPDLGRADLAPNEQAARARQNEFAWAFDALTLFEWWHGPRGVPGQDAAHALSGREVLRRAQSADAPSPARWPATHHWSATRFGGHPFFLMDTRTERARGWRDRPDQIVSDEQMNALLDWLLACAPWPGPKFIVTGSPIAPAPYAVMRDYRCGLFDDAWWGFPRQLREILAMIAREQIQRVVFIGGDSHLGALSTLSASFTGADGRAGPPVEVRSVVSSGLFIPLPGVNGRPSEYPPADREPDGGGPAYPYSPASGTVRSARGTLDGGAIACTVRIHDLRFTEHIAIIEAPDLAAKGRLPDHSSAPPNPEAPPWPAVTFRP